MPEQRQIAEDDDGIRLDRWFKRHYPALTHARLEKLLRKGEVRLDGKRAKSADRIMAGQTLRLPPQVIHDKIEPRLKSAAPVQTSRKLEDTILYMDKHLFVLNKPPGLATQGGSGLKEHVDGMLDQLTYEKTIRPKLVHRLDRDT
jgi:23S rRNA pseudouridine955/2504/2580 synthase